MDHRRIRYAFRKGSEHVNPYAPGSEVDILIDRLVKDFQEGRLDDSMDQEQRGSDTDAPASRTG